jgi:hypothetical protein
LVWELVMVHRSQSTKMSVLPIWLIGDSHSLDERCTRYNIMWWSLSVTYAGRWFSPVSSTNKIDRHDITEILLKVALNSITHLNRLEVARFALFIITGKVHWLATQDWCFEVKISEWLNGDKNTTRSEQFISSIEKS